MASRSCKDYGMNLVTIQSSMDLRNAKVIMELAGLEKDILWTDGTDLGNENNFYWDTTGEKFDYAPWWHTQSDNLGGNENCVGIVEWYLQFVIVDDDCSKPFHFMCSRQNLKNIDVECSVIYSH